MIFSTFVNSVKKNQNLLGVFLSIFSTFTNSVMKTQDTIGGLLAIFNKCLNFKQDPGYFRRFCVNFELIFPFCKKDPVFFRKFSTFFFILTLQPDLT